MWLRGAKKIRKEVLILGTQFISSIFSAQGLPEFGPADFGPALVIPRDVHKPENKWFMMVREYPQTMN